MEVVRIKITEAGRQVLTGRDSHDQKKRRTYLPRIVGDKVMMPADIKLHKYMREVEHISIVSDEMREMVEELWPDLAHKLPPKRSRS